MILTQGIANSVKMAFGETPVIEHVNCSTVNLTTVTRIPAIAEAVKKTSGETTVMKHVP